VVAEHLHVGDCLGAHGLKGTLIVYSHTRPADAVAGYSCWWLGKTAESAKAFAVKRCWQHGKRVLADLEGVADRNAAEELKGVKIWIPAAEVAVDDDEFLWQELIGCEVFLEESNELLGTVTALEEYGAQDNLLIRTPDDVDQPGEWAIPFIDSIVTAIDIDDAVIMVDLPEGMDACFTPRS